MSEPIKLIRNNGEIIFAEMYNNLCIDKINVLKIKKLKFSGMKTKDITKSHIRNIVFEGEEKLYLQNKYADITACLSKTHLNKIISTVFTKDSEGKYSYLKKEIISNVNMIFYSALPILKHSELKNQALYNNQIVHRFAIPLEIGGFTFLVMITVKERTDYNKISVDEFSIYDLYSKNIDNKKPFGSPSAVSQRTFRSQCQTVTFSLTDLCDFVKCSIRKTQPLLCYK